MSQTVSLAARNESFNKYPFTSNHIWYLNDTTSSHLKSVFCTFLGYFSNCVFGCQKQIIPYHI
jgi:hypothetical protein